ncbi:hypothetical protein ACTMTI_05330 [Nonomuraea sp. H19]|uniref:hypothetical protein n=1 Tax=Nonomuraea sp. H19 TaxID=3452206 RepID=UPI003F8B7CCD
MLLDSGDAPDQHPLSLRAFDKVTTELDVVRVGRRRRPTRAEADRCLGRRRRAVR